MSSGGSQANKFYEEVGSSKELWFGVLPNETLLELDLEDEVVSFPVWSTESRISRLKKLNPELMNEVTPSKVSWLDFKKHYVPLLEGKNRVIGVNLSGKNLSGFDITIDSLIRQVEAFE